MTYQDVGTNANMASLAASGKFGPLRKLQRIQDAESNLMELSGRVNTVGELTEALESLGIGLSSPRANSACRRYSYGVGALEVIREAVQHERQVRELWVTTALAPWCERHGISLLQGLSVAFDDQKFDPDNPQKERVTLENLFWGGQQIDFTTRLKLELL